MEYTLFCGKSITAFGAKLALAIYRNQLPDKHRKAKIKISFWK